MLQATAQGSSTGVLDGLKLWMELLLLVGAAFSGYLGYKVNQIIFRPGGLGDRVDKSETEIVKLHERTDNNTRRLENMERRVFRTAFERDRDD